MYVAVFFALPFSLTILYNCLAQSLHLCKQIKKKPNKGTKFPGKIKEKKKKTIVLPTTSNITYCVYLNDWV